MQIHFNGVTTRGVSRPFLTRRGVKIECQRKHHEGEGRSGGNFKPLPSHLGVFEKKMLQKEKMALVLLGLASKIEKFHPLIQRAAVKENSLKAQY